MAANDAKFPRELSVYDGVDLLGTIEVRVREGRKSRFEAKNTAGRRVGTFDDQAAAMRALGEK